MECKFASSAYGTDTSDLIVKQVPLGQLTIGKSLSD
jgi:hypothetical protein